MSVRWSIVITTRNRAKMLDRALASCAGQTTPCEVVVIDEASTDETPDVVKRFPNVRYARNEVPLGHSAAANMGIKAASGEWIKPLDDDDWLTANCIETFTHLLEGSHDLGFRPTLVSGRVINVDEHETELGRTRMLSETAAGLRSSNLLKMMMIDQAPLGTPVQVGHNREAALRVGGWNENRRFTHQHGDETELWIKLAGQGDAIFTPEFVAYRTIWPGGSQQRIPHYDRFISNVSLKNLIAEQAGEPTPQSVKSYLALHWALVAAKEKRFGSSIRLMGEWIKRPASVFHLLHRSPMKDVRRFLEPVRIT
jgi:glycosyltransferase involved in cell wall biosynthesis